MLSKIYNYYKEHLLIPTIIILSSLITITSFMALVLSVSPINVLTDWKITTDKQQYSLGDTINIRSTGEKRFDMPGDSERTLVCVSGPRTSTYPLNKSVNTNVGTGEFDLNIPVTLPVTLEMVPRTCRVDIDVKYPWYGFRSTNQTNEFLIKE